jgi:hypothetical protein
MLAWSSARATARGSVSWRGTCCARRGPRGATPATWIVVVGSGPYPRGLEQPPDGVPRAISNPSDVDVDGNGVFDPPGGKACDLRGLPVR